MTPLLVALGAAAGAPLRYLTDRWVQTWRGSVFPWGTLAVNVTGSLLLGLLAGLAADGAVLALAGVGLCGTYTTYSTFGYETLRLLQTRARLLALANVVVSVGAALGACALGVLLGGAVGS